MIKKILIVFLCIITVVAVSARDKVFSSSITVGNRNVETPQSVEQQREQFEIKTTPVNGMMPIFEDEAISQNDEFVQEILTIVTPKPEKSQQNSTQNQPVVNESGNLFLPQVINQGGGSYSAPSSPKKPQQTYSPDTVEVLMTSYIEQFSQVKVLENTIKNAGEEGVAQEIEENYVQAVSSFENTGFQIVDLIRENAEYSVNRITEFIIKNVKKGDLIALANVIEAMMEYLESDQTVIDSENASKLHYFFEKMHYTIEGLVAFLESDDVAEKYFILYLIINNMFINDYEPLDIPEFDFAQTAEVDVAPEEPAQQQPAPPQTPPQSQAVAPPATGSGHTGTLSSNIDFAKIIENGEFIDSITMTAPDIQRFLESRGSVLKNQYRGQYPSAIIYAVCNEYKINPKVILATIQKEHSLISRRTASQEQLDWGLGVGCYDNGTKNEKFRGLEKQLASAVRVFRHWYDDGIKNRVSQNGYSMRVNYNTTNHTIRNEATYSLFRYTPHTVDIKLNTTGGGNHLFSRLYIQYFGGFLK